MKFLNKENNNLLLFILMGVAASAMVYQFSVISALTFILGDTVTLFSIFSGVFLCAMGFGAVLSAKISNNEAQFVGSQLILAFVGLVTLPLLFLIYAVLTSHQQASSEADSNILIIVMWFFGITAELIFGSLIGLQLPLLQAIITRRHKYFGTESKIDLSKILAIDYLGSFIGAVAFPLILFPCLGIFKAVFLTALLNTVLSFISAQLLNFKSKKVTFAASCLFVLILAAYSYSDSIENMIDVIIYGKS